ncbi:hypothetical protein CHLNCDRAFT_52248 [Chlorella variabilis]|uniref:MI domain-containing protein n=1 Tax=Chlorella variabilis TaxID=554065 RepID=E1ZF72_CHLVA|nr:hypothetical protein CHLNCDRAFT_52248 [Chlorella variabilis]EFN55449.1 hypothetical protein CHLNCDRAFT_52248 [Chlorella variabilis]|eukprot:XP_005847551.1 hypothetical protein CHLNCDRAFT_52248 [Chlorella variabilis]
MGKRSPSRDSSPSAKRRKDDSRSDDDKSRSRGHSRSRSRSRSTSSSRSRGSRSSRSTSTSRSRSRDRRSRSRSRSQDRRRSRGDDRRRSRSRSRSRRRDEGPRGGGRWGDRRPSPPRRGRSPPPRRVDRGDGDERPVRNGPGPDRRQIGDRNGVAAEAAPPAEAAAPAAAPEPRERKPVAAGPAGGVYIPPFKLAQMMAEAADRESAQYQRMTWDALRKSINGLVNKVNAANIKHILPEVFGENLVRGRGLFCRSIMKSQMASPSFTPGGLFLSRWVLGAWDGHRALQGGRSGPPDASRQVCRSACMHIWRALGFSHPQHAQLLGTAAQLPWQLWLAASRPPGKRAGGPRRGVAAAGHRPTWHMHQLIATCDSVLRRRAATSPITSSSGCSPGSTCLQFKRAYKRNDKPVCVAAIKFIAQLANQQVVHELLPLELLLLLLETPSDDGVEVAVDFLKEVGPLLQDLSPSGLQTIMDRLRSIMQEGNVDTRTQYIGIPAGLEMELTTMIIECCSNEKTFIKYYALLGERFCKYKREYADCFSEAFVQQYQLIHRLETNKLRNTAKLFAHLLTTDAIPWAVMQVIRLTEEDTTSSSRIFIKILFQARRLSLPAPELAETMGLMQLNKRLNDPTCQDWFMGVFPRDSPRNMRFAINFFTSIGLGGLTDSMREVLKNLPKMLAAQQAAAAAAAGSGSDSDSDSSSSSSSSDSDSDSSSSSSSSGSGSSSSSSSSSGSSSSDDSSGSSSSEGEEEPARGKGKSKGGGRSPPPPVAERGGRSSPPPAERRRGAGAAGGREEPPLNGRPGSDRELAERRRDERVQRRDSRERVQRRSASREDRRERGAGRSGEDRRRRDRSDSRGRGRR